MRSFRGIHSSSVLLGYAPAKSEWRPAHRGILDFTGGPRAGLVRGNNGTAGHTRVRE